MIVFRWLSLVLMVMAVMLLGADVVGTLERKEIYIRSLQEVLLLFNYNAREALLGNLDARLANLGIAVVESPSWLSLAIVGIVFAFVAPSSKPTRPLPPPPPIPR